MHVRWRMAASIQQHVAYPEGGHVCTPACSGQGVASNPQHIRVPWELATPGAEALRGAPPHQPLLGASMLQARQRPDSGGVNRLEERLWPSSPAKRLCGAPAGRLRLSNQSEEQLQNQFAYAE